jgi:hypothetical protein
MKSINTDSLATQVKLRQTLKVVRDPTKTAFDRLASGETLGSFANFHAVERYKRKVESKRVRARVNRSLKRGKRKMKL